MGPYKAQFCRLIKRRWLVGSAARQKAKKESSEA
jgi:hypothetical protein